MTWSLPCNITVNSNTMEEKKSALKGDLHSYLWIRLNIKWLHVLQSEVQLPSALIEQITGAMPKIKHHWFPVSLVAGSISPSVSRNTGRCNCFIVKTYNAGKDIRKNNSLSRPAHVKNYVLWAQGLIALFLTLGGLRLGRLEVQSLSEVYNETLFQTNRDNKTQMFNINIEVIHTMISFKQFFPFEFVWLEFSNL